MSDAPASRLTDFVLFPKKTYWIVAGLLLVLFATTLYHRIAHFDDAWCTEQSYQLLKGGIVRSELFRGYNFWGEQMFVFHKAFVYAQVPVLAALGCSIWAARLVPMLFSVVGLLLLIRYFRGQVEAQWLAAVLYIGCGCLWLFGVDNRPETMTLAFGFASFLLLQRAPRSTGTLAAAAVLAGLAGLTHLNGIIYLAAGASWLLFREGWSRALPFGLVGGIVTSLYALDAVLAGQLDRLLFQFGNDHAAQANFHWQAKLKVMASYDKLFFHSDGEVPLTVFVLAIVGAVLARALTRRLVLTASMQYLLWLLGAFWLLTKSMNVYYYLLFVPFFIAAAVDLLSRAWPHFTRTQRRAVVLVCCLYPLGGVARTRYLLLENATDGNVMAENALLATYMPQRGAKVIAPLDFFFGQMPHYRVRSLTYFALTNNEQPLPDFFAAAARDTVRYIVCDYRQWNQAYHIPRTAPVRIGPYERVYQGRWRGVYVRK
ncbi:hypothetical protein [Hymenobacter sp.]|uniref:hypothetical protein n=1 Tax=Hymenobacter sp. TaxID=1898978 RepID=UPI00286BA96D|nr:hypothetical protein [Hymenobacter sp.]